MIKVVILFTAIITVSWGQYLRQQHPPAAAWGRSAAYRGNGAGYTNWAQPGYAAYGGAYRAPAAYGGAYGGAYRAPIAPIAYGGGYRAPVAPIAYGGIRGGYVAPAVAPIAVAQPQYYGGRYAEDESYKPYNFGYSTVDEYGTQLGRQEAADGSGNVRGSYSYKDPNGQYRQVEYVADQGGFRAEINTNEAGVVSHRPADAVYNHAHNK